MTPTNSISSYDDRPMGGSATVGEALSNTAARAKEKVADLGRSAANQIDANRDAAASGMEKVASTLHDKAESLPGGQPVTGLAHAAADKLNSGAQYVRAHNANRMMADLEKLVKNNPGPALLAGGVIGFLVGRAFLSLSND
jgi:ElaB/YqjD/DUF883 family membrane-anchored ribosome-binding protein